VINPNSKYNNGQPFNGSKSDPGCKNGISKDTLGNIYCNTNVMFVPDVNCSPGIDVNSLCSIPDNKCLTCSSIAVPQLQSGSCNTNVSSTGESLVAVQCLFNSAPAPSPPAPTVFWQCQTVASDPTDPTKYPTQRCMQSAESGYIRREDCLANCACLPGFQRGSNGNCYQSAPNFWGLGFNYDPNQTGQCEVEGHAEFSATPNDVSNNGGYMANCCGNGNSGLNDCSCAIQMPFKIPQDDYYCQFDSNGENPQWQPCGTSGGCDLCLASKISPGATCSNYPLSTMSPSSLSTCGNNWYGTGYSAHGGMFPATEMPNGWCAIP